jgi:hypothetical protein
VQIRNKIRIPEFIAILAILAWGGPSLAMVNDPFPTPEPPTRAAAMQVVTAQSGIQGCLTAGTLLARTTADGSALESALDRLTGLDTIPMERRLELGNGVRLRYAGFQHPASRATGAKFAREVQGAVAQVRQLVEGRLELALPDELEIVIRELGTGLDGYCVVDGAAASILIDSSQTRHPRALRDNVIRQVAKSAVAMAGPHASGGWAGAFADWVVSEIDARPQPEALGRASARLANLEHGLFTSEPTSAAGQWIWFAFLAQAYGSDAVSVSVQELAGDNDEVAALDRAVTRATGERLSQVFREFHLWSFLTGDRADRHHFNFATALASAEFASGSEGLPALSVQTDAPMALWSATQVRLVPDAMDAADGGLGVRFEGEFDSSWEADLLVIDLEGQMRRMVVELEDGAGSAVVPLGSIAEAILMIRRLDGDSQPQRYTYAAHREAAYPWLLNATQTRRQERGATIEWETGSEQELIGFNVLRSRLDGDVELPVNPVWIPALGEQGEATLYEFLDRDALPGVAYRYRVEAITSGGWTTRSPYFVLPAR